MGNRLLLPVRRPPRYLLVRRYPLSTDRVWDLLGVQEGLAMTEQTIDHGFISMCRQEVEDMRRAGMNETMIACVVTGIRAAAINAEFLRVKLLLDANPPYHAPWPHMKVAING